MATRTGNVDIIGTGWAFPPAFDQRSGAALLVAQEVDVEESLRILLGTTPGERVMQPGYGCGLRRVVFETVNTSMLTEIRSLVEKAVLFFEPRISLEHVEIEIPEPFDGVLYLQLMYSMRVTNTRHNLVYPLYLNEASGQVGPAP